MNADAWNDKRSGSVQRVADVVGEAGMMSGSWRGRLFMIVVDGPGEGIECGGILDLRGVDCAVA